MTFPFGESVTVTNRTKSGEDSDGNDVFTSSSTVVAGCAVWQPATTEEVQGRDQVTVDLEAVLPADTVITATSKVTARGDDYEVMGQPEPLRNVFTGSAPGVHVRLRRVTG